MYVARFSGRPAMIGKLKGYTGTLLYNCKLTNSSQAFYSSIVRWKYLSHPNLLPFLGVSETGPLTLVSPWMPNNIIGYTANGVAATRLQLVGAFQN